MHNSMKRDLSLFLSIQDCTTTLLNPQVPFLELSCIRLTMLPLVVVLGEYKEAQSEWVQKLVAGMSEKVTLDETASTKVVGFGRYSKKSAPPERKRQKTKQEKPKEKNK